MQLILNNMLDGICYFILFQDVKIDFKMKRTLTWVTHIELLIIDPSTVSSGNFGKTKPETS